MFKSEFNRAKIEALSRSNREEANEKLKALVKKKAKKFLRNCEREVEKSAAAGYWVCRISYRDVFEKTLWFWERRKYEQLKQSAEIRTSLLLEVELRNHFKGFGMEFEPPFSIVILVWRE